MSGTGEEWFSTFPWCAICGESLDKHPTSDCMSEVDGEYGTCSTCHGTGYINQ